MEAILNLLDPVKKKPSVRLRAARLFPEESSAESFVKEFASDFKRVGGDAIRVDESLDSPIAVDIQVDGKIVLVINPKKLDALGWDEWSVVWDEELRHAALFSFARSRVPEGFAGDVGLFVRQELSAAWASIDEADRIKIEKELASIYGDNLDDVQRTAELVRMVGQRQITEGVTKRGLGQRFLDLVRDFANWLQGVFKGSMPKPIRDLVDGAEFLLERLDGEAVGLSPDFGFQAADERNETAIQAAAAEPNARLDSQRLTAEQVQRLSLSQNLSPEQQQRLTEQEAALADLLSSTTRDELKDIEASISTPPPSGVSAFDRRIYLDNRTAEQVAFSKLEYLRQLADLTNRLPSGTVTPAQEVMMGSAPSGLTDRQKAEVLHDMSQVVAWHERLDFELARLNDMIDRDLAAEASAIKELNRVLGSLSSPEAMRTHIKSSIDSFRSDVARAINLARVVDRKAASYSMQQNIPVAADQAAVSAALGILSQKGAVEDLKFLIERLANHPQLQNLAGWPYDADQFYDQLVSSGVLADAIANGPGLAQSQTISVVTRPVSANTEPLLKVWGQLRDIIESLQGYKDEYNIAKNELAALSKLVDPLANPAKGQPFSDRRALRVFQAEVRKREYELSRLNRLDKKLRSASLKRRSTERAYSVLANALNEKQYREFVSNAFTHIHRRSNTIIQDGERPGMISIKMPIPYADGSPRVVTVELSVEQKSTDENRLKVEQVIQEMSMWLAANPDADPALREAYVHASRRLSGFLNPDYAISNQTINEAGLWGVLGAPLKWPVIRAVLHPVLKDIEDSAKGMGRGLIQRAMVPFVQWGVFEQGLRNDVVRIRRTKRDGMQSHGLKPKFELFSKDIIDPWRMDREDDAYRWLVIEPIIRSWQHSFQYHIKAGSILDDATGAISSSGKIVVTKEDIEAARAQVDYESKVRKFTSNENFGMQGSAMEMDIVEQSVGGDQRSRLPFAAGPGVMSRSLSSRADGRAMDKFRWARNQIPQTVGKDKGIRLVSDGMETLRKTYLGILRGTVSGGVTDDYTWQDVVMSHIRETNPEYGIRHNSKLARVYDSIAQDLSTDPSFRIGSWSELISVISSRMQSVLNDARTPAERAAEAETILSRELTQGMENIRSIIDGQESAALQNVSVLSPKSSFNTARGHIVGPPGLYEHGLHSDFAINALHGTVIRHVSDNLVKQLKVLDTVLGDYIEKNKGESGGTIAERKMSAAVAYKIGEALRLQKAIKDQIQLMEEFEQATHDPEQYYHDAMRWGSLLLIRPLVSPLTNTFSVVKDTLLTMHVVMTMQQRSLWGVVNWMFAAPKAMEYWVKGATTLMLSSFAKDKSEMGILKRAAASIIPGLSAAAHSASRRAAEARLRSLGAIKSISFVDQMILMETSGSLLGVQGAEEYEKTRPVRSKVIKYIDRVFSKIPGAKAAVQMLGEGRTVFEDINNLMMASVSEDNYREIVRRAMAALEAREKSGGIITSMNSSAFPLTDEEMGMTFGGMRQVRRWFDGGEGFDALMLSMYLGNRGKSADQIVEQSIGSPTWRVWMANAMTNAQMQTLRERPPIAWKKGMVGRVARSFGTFRTWTANWTYSLLRGEILKVKPWKPFYTRNPEELGRMIVMLLTMLTLGAPSILFVDWLRDKLGRPVGLTISNLIEKPSLQGALMLALHVASNVLPNSSAADDFITGATQGTIDITRMNPLLGGAMDFVRTMATIASTSNIKDPESVLDSAAYNLRGFMVRRIGNFGMGVGLSDQGYRQFVEAGRAVRSLAPSDIERVSISAGRIPTSPANDNVRKAVELATGGKFEEAEAEARKGYDQLVESGVAPDAARKKINAAFSAKSAFRGGFERSLTDEEKTEIIERATPKQREAILNREQAVKRLAGMFSKGQSSFAVSGGRAVRLPSVKKLAARRGLSQRLAAMSPSKQFARPIQIRTRRRQARSRDRLARIARLRKRLGIAP